MTQLKHSTTVFEVVQCLRCIQSILQDIDRSDRLKFCKNDYDNAVKILRKNKGLWCNDLFRETINISLTYFDVSIYRIFPIVLFWEIILWLPSSELFNLLTINNEWLKNITHNDLWKALYQRKFLMNNPNSHLPILPSPSSSLSIHSSSYYSLMMNAYKSRLEDPEIGDKVEVAWKGKFRLETQDVYQGLAWWVAEVVDKNKSQGKYKIRYPGWESRWDEWVPRSRLRWTVASNTVCQIEAGDAVELWCCGVNVPGAWLESKVKKTRGNRYCLGKVLSSGSLWVERDRLRLVKKAADIDDLDERDSEGNARTGRSRGRSRGFSIAAGLSHRLSAALSKPTSCAIM
jgi:hypothetical protein